MKIGIITITNGENYGNRLQNYAVQYVLESLGCEVETIKNTTKQRKISKIKDKLNIISPIYDVTKIKKIQLLNRLLRAYRFNKFTKKYIHKSKFIINKNLIPIDIKNYYDYFVCGSDQIWNPKFYFNSEIDFLTFAKPEQRIAYAPSFGIDEIPKENVDEYKKLINGIRYLSVREKSGAQIIKTLTGRKVEVLIDPTLMLTKKEWLKISSKPKINLNERYILIYFLGILDEETKENIKNISKEKGLKIINLLDVSNKESSFFNPEEFIYLINNAELMCTDSFHGVAFSILMNTNFLVFSRKGGSYSMNSRMENILELFNMKDRIYEKCKDKESFFNMNFNKVEAILDREREKALEYLKTSLKIEICSKEMEREVNG